MDFALPKLFNPWADPESVISQSFDSSMVREFIWENRTWIGIGGGALAVGLLTIGVVSSMRQRATPPRVEWRSSLNKGRLTITTPRRETSDAGTLTICIDTSRSMKKGDALKAVQASVCSVLDYAQSIVNKSPSRRFGVGVVSFSKDANVVTPPSELTPSAREESKAESEEGGLVSRIKKQVNALVPDGRTEIVKGLSESVTSMEAMVGRYPKGSSHSLVVLSDGCVIPKEANQIESFNNSLRGLFTRIKKIGAKFFVIGIGNHKALDQIAKQAKSIAGHGEYVCINDVREQDSVSRTLKQVYAESVPSYLAGITSSLPAGTWSVNNSPSTQCKEDSGCFFGLLPDEPSTHNVEISLPTLKTDIDLSQVGFDLHYSDRDHREGHIHIPWNPNSRIDRSIVS